jgi:hypothetical protein
MFVVYGKVLLNHPYYIQVATFEERRRWLQSSTTSEYDFSESDTEADGPSDCLWIVPGTYVGDE